ncbi:hypothetical protein [Clostridium beijerinckii]|uniref:hypothetical protein n=1 Tax=Clostridium beijerinckii TaxID=1520 RepID=UPI0003D2EA88|nr:hypothetical protein [Clostridium beijerinckii]ALB46569.1 tryptophan-rich sensory protein [Clostridium beijerinckii NRRL B-598]
MSYKKVKANISIFTTVLFFIMISTNVLANILPINGVTTSNVSDSYKNLFAPAGLTFIIWGAIYFLLAGYISYQLGFFKEEKTMINEAVFEKVRIYFCISSIANAMWIISWHYNIIILSMILMIVILVSLVLIIKTVKKEELSLREKLFLKLPFSIYYGWITIATIANAVVLMVSLGLRNIGMSEIYTSIIIVLGVFLGIRIMLKNKDIAYGLVIIWAYIGILIKHTAQDGFGGQYHLIINSLIISLVLLTLIEVYLILKRLTKYFSKFHI